MQCPKCQSDNTQRLQVIYDAGTHHIATTSSSVIVGGAASGYGGGTASTSTSGTQQSYQAAKAAPPPRKSMQVGGWLVTIGVFMQMFTTYRLAVLGLIVGGVYLIVQARKYNATVWPPLRHQWENSWMCNKCGNMYSTLAS